MMITIRFVKEILGLIYVLDFNLIKSGHFKIVIGCTLFMLTVAVFIACICHLIPHMFVRGSIHNFQVRNWEAC